MQVTAMGTELQKLAVGLCIENEPLSKHTSFGIGGRADLLVLPGTEEELAGILGYAADRGIRVIVMGNGTNLLVSDEGIRGIVIKVSRMNRVEFHENAVVCGCGASLMAVARMAARNGLSGLEFASGIPASIGGAVYMNAGAEGRCMSHVVKSVRYVEPSGLWGELDASRLDFGYRSTSLHGTGRIVVQATLELRRENSASILRRLDQCLERRKTTQPYALRSAGSYFKNPPGDSAGRLIESAGCKGWQVGHAKISLMHANFIVNTGGATAREVLELAARVKSEVRNRFGVTLEPEVRYIE